MSTDKSHEHLPTPQLIALFQGYPRCKHATLSTVDLFMHLLVLPALTGTQNGHPIVDQLRYHLPTQATEVIGTMAKGPNEFHAGHS